MKQRAIVADCAEIINEMLKDGWEIESVTPQHVSVSTTSYGLVRGNFCFVLKKKEV